MLVVTMHQIRRSFPLVTLSPVEVGMCGNSDESVESEVPSPRRGPAVDVSTRVSVPSL